MIEFDANRRKWLFMLSGVLCVCVAFALVAAFRGKFGPDTAPLTTNRSSETGEMTFSGAVQRESWIVYVTGAVAYPGVYEVQPDSRVNDAVIRAGGFSPEADPEGINLAARLEDGMHVKVPLKGERETTDPEKATSDDRPQAPPRAPEPEWRPGASLRLDINRASVEELRTLPGIGPVISRAIVDYRMRYGAFTAVDDLLNVKGIGAGRLDVIRELVVVR